MNYSLKQLKVFVTVAQEKSFSRAGERIGLLIDAALARNGIQANIVQEIGHPATLFPMVAAGIGISILPALALPLPAGSPLVVKRITPVVERQLMLVRRKNRSLSTAAQALWDVVRDQGNALMAQASASVFFPHWRYHCLKVAHWW